MTDFNGLSRVLGSESIAIGRVVELAPNLGDDITIEGMRFLREGFFETNIANFDEAFFAADLRKTQVAAVFPAPSSAVTVAALGASAVSASGEHMAVFVAGTASTVFYGAVYASSDYGKTWRLLASNLNRNDAVTGAPTICVSEDGYVGWAYHNGASTSSASVYNPTTGRVVTQTLTQNNVCDIACAPTGGVFVVVGGTATYRFSAGAWATVTTTGATAPHKVYTYDGTVWFVMGDTSATTISRSADGGATWSSVTVWSVARRAYDMDSANGTNLVVTSDNADVVARSSNAGASWTQVTLSPTTGVAYSGVVATSANNFTLQSTAAGDIVYSTDGGATWADSDVTGLFSQGAAPARGGVFGGVVHVGSGELFAYTRSTPFLFYRSTNHGQNWSAINLVPAKAPGSSTRLTGNKKGTPGNLLIMELQLLALTDSSISRATYIPGPVAGLPISADDVDSAAVRYMRVS